MEKDLQHSIDYITSKTSNKRGFSIPKDYFNKFEDVVLSNITEANLPKEESFAVPSEYFTSLEDKILTKITSEEKTKQKNKGKIILFQESIQRIIPYASVAASILLFISIYFLNNRNSQISLDDISVAEIENWYDNGYGNANNTALAMVIETSDFNDDDIASIILSDENLENYFNSTDDTTVLLFNEIQ